MNAAHTHLLSRYRPAESEASVDRVAIARQLAEDLASWLGQEPAICVGETGALLHLPAGQPARDWSLREALVREVASHGRPEFIEDESPVVVLAIPLSTAGARLVAVGAFLLQPATKQNAAPGASALGLSVEAFQAWAAIQPVWSPATLLNMAQLGASKYAAESRVVELQQENRHLAEVIAGTYEEITLLYRLTHHLRLSSNDEELGRLALQSLGDVIAAESLALQLVPLPESASASVAHRATPTLLTHGDCPLDSERFAGLIERLGLKKDSRPFVANTSVTNSAEWAEPELRNVVIVPVAEGQNLFGWLAAFNHQEGREFGTDEAHLLASVATILGVHAGNIELYRQQADLLAGVIRALTSAIDAKDPYTCGHSDRVSRVAVRIAQELGFDSEFLNTVYLSGLLHDVGKIGIEETVLRKPGRLTPAEYEHIKTHPDIGYTILKDLKKLSHLLPGVRHHHESWDGSGYPDGMQGADIPVLARIIAVADSFDAMGSDRPYRKGMEDDKLDAILLSGAGKQWDPSVVEAFFRVREDVRQIAEKQPEGIDPTLPIWVQHVAAELEQPEVGQGSP